MIKLEKKMYDSIKDKYVTNITEQINENYNKQKKEISDKKYFDQIQVKDFVETSGEFDDEKIRKLLLLDFSEINNLYFKNYLEIAYICYDNEKKEKILTEIKDDETLIRREDYCKKIIDYFNNDWVKNFLLKDNVCYKDDKKAKSRISEIKEVYIILRDKVKKEFDEFNEEIKKVIDYKLIKSDLRHEIIVSSNISICPYCNRQYISNYKKNKKTKKTTADLDHFYPKSIFQLFSLSLYNFIPACQICNRYFKGKNIKKILYPFEKEFGIDAKFGINVYDMDACYGLSDHFDIDIDINDESSNKEEIINSIDVFNLESIYQNHKTYVQEILQKKELIYTDTYLEMMNNTFNELNFTKEQIDTFYYGFNINDDINKDTKPLGKLTRDIFEK